MKHLLVFFLVFLSNLLWAWYIRTVAQGKSILASLLAAGIMVFSVLAFTEIVADKIYIVSAAIGAFFGTFCAIRLEKSFKSSNLEFKETTNA